MAENVVTFLLEKLDRVLSSNLELVLSLEVKIRSLRNKLALLQAFLEDVDARRRDNKRIRVWVDQVREVAFHAEDAIDRYLYEVQFKKRGGLMGSLRNCAGVAHRLRVRHQLGTEIAGIRQMLQEISDSKSEFGIEFKQPEGEASSSTYSPLEGRVSNRPMPMVEETNVVGFDRDIEILKEKLLQGDQRRSAVSIVGMGGLGKTTLARKVYDSDDVMSHFQCRAWVYVSQRYSTQGLLQALLEHFSVKKGEKADQTTIDSMIRQLKDHLMTRKYLLVIDDIWNGVAWDAIQGALPDGNNGSRIMVTTRNKEVADHVDPRGFKHEPRCLTDGESWDLFCLRAFGSKDGCPTELREIGKKMVSECAGLPLAVTVLGGLLSRKPKSDVEWRKVLKRITYELHGREGGTGPNVKRILALSYDDLPYYLRSCFLYFGLFPEDSEIDVEELIRLWVAEGFVQARGEQTLEEVAEDYLEELVNRCMIQVVESNSWGRVSRCRIHDLLHDLSISQGMDDKFLAILSSGNGMPANIYNAASSVTSPRRAAIHNQIVSDNCIPATHRSSSSLLRTVLCFRTEEFASISQVCRSVSNLKLLTVLNVKVLVEDDDDLIINRLPKQIGRLVHLRYLGLEVSGHVLDLPPSVGQLRNLQTLRVGEDSVVCLVPDALWKIEALRHVIGENLLVMKGRHIGRNSKQNLQTLWGIHAGSWVRRSLGEFTNLRALRMWCILATHVPELARSLGRLTRLNKLRLEFVGSVPTTMVRALLAQLVNHPVLYELVIVLDIASTFLSYRVALAGGLLCGCIKFPGQFICSEIPNLMVQAFRSFGGVEGPLPQEGGSHQTPLRFPPSLTRLNVRLAGLILSDQLEADLASLESLPNLVILKLSGDAYAGKVMVFSPRGFGKLQELQLSSLDNLEEWTIGHGAMPCLKKLKIEDCRQLKMLPEGLPSITTLQQLELPDMPEQFTRRTRKDDGEDWHKVQHIPSVVI